jgi:2-polyprenyl-6-methoxyphenol hydroxylase-like FAD-dependent oxidoreductase
LEFWKVLAYETPQPWMKHSGSTKDVVIIGAGPTGCAAALAFAKRGAEVLLVEAQPDAAKRFAGEWMHPPAVRALRQLGVDTESLGAARGHGFVLFGSDGLPPVQLPYVRGTGIARIHHDLVEDLRDYARRDPLIEYLPFYGFAGLDGRVVELENRKTRERLKVRAGRVIGADGRKSKVLAALGEAQLGQPLGFMMGIELSDVVMPYEGLGHVFFGGPGPALFYRVGDRTVRGCLDVPDAAGSEARKKENVLSAFLPHLPGSWRGEFERSLSGATPWAATRFQPRSCFGKDHVWLAGDAVGHVHPVSGMGMTFGILDAVAAAQASNLDEYRVARGVYVSELLTNVLYSVFRRHDESATRVRHGLLQMLREHPVERRRTMQVLTGEDSRGSTFIRSFLRASGYAIGHTVSEVDPTAIGLMALAQALKNDAAWLKWPLGALVGDLTSSGLLRGQSSCQSPFPPIEQLVAAGSSGAVQAYSSAIYASRGALQASQQVSRWLTRKEIS